MTHPTPVRRSSTLIFRVVIVTCLVVGLLILFGPFANRAAPPREAAGQALLHAFDGQELEVVDAGGELARERVEPTLKVYTMACHRHERRWREWLGTARAQGPDRFDCMLRVGRPREELRRMLLLATAWPEPPKPEELESAADDRAPLAWVEGFLLQAYSGRRLERRLSEIRRAAW